MKKIKFIIVVMIFSLLGTLCATNNVYAANQYGYPEALYNPTMDRWEADLSESPLYEGTDGLQFTGFVYWMQDPTIKNLIYNPLSFSPGGPGSYNQVAIEYPSDNGVRRSIYLLYVGPVKVEYKESGTETVLATKTYLTGHEGETYTTQSIEIPGYQLDYIQGNETGNFSFLGADYGSVGNPNLSNSVTYYYKKLPVAGVAVTVNYVDEEGNTIASSETLTGKVSETYTSIQKSIPGYTFKEVRGNATGQFTDQAQIVTYVYTKANVNLGQPDLNSNNISNNSYRNEQNSQQDSLPETGEGENMIWVLGFALLSVALAVVAYRFRKLRKI